MPNAVEQDLGHISVALEEGRAFLESYTLNPADFPRLMAIMKNSVKIMQIITPMLEVHLPNKDTDDGREETNRQREALLAVDDDMENLLHADVSFVVPQIENGNASSNTSNTPTSAPLANGNSSSHRIVNETEPEIAAPMEVDGKIRSTNSPVPMNDFLTNSNSRSPGKKKQPTQSEAMLKLEETPRVARRRSSLGANEAVPSNDVPGAELSERSPKRATSSPHKSKSTTKSGGNEDHEVASDSSCLIVSVEPASKTQKNDKKSKAEKKKAASKRKRVASSSDESDAPVVTSLPLNRWQELVRDGKLGQVPIVRVERIESLPVNQTTFDASEQAKLGFAVSSNKASGKKQNDKRASEQDTDDEVNNLLRMADAMPRTTSSQPARRSLRTTHRSSSSSDRPTSTIDSEQEEEEEEVQQDSPSYRLTDENMSDKDELEIDLDDEEETENDDEEEEELSDPDFKPKSAKKKAGEQKKNSSKSEVPSDVQRLLRKRISVGANVAANGGSEKSSAAESDDPVVMRRSQGKNQPEDAETISDSYEPSDSDFEPSSAAKRRSMMKAKKKKGDEDDDDDDDDFEEGGGVRKRVTRSRSTANVKKKTPSRTVIIDEETNSNDLDDDKGDKKKKRRRIKRNSELELSTRKALREEKERQQRISERQKMYNEALLNSTVAVSEGQSSIVLECDPETKQPILQVNPNIARKMKKHQIEVVHFMWQTTCESLEQLRKPESQGSGCIVAHCMGLGKTLSTISFIHTLIANRDITGIKTCLILSPLNIVLNWLQEFRRWVPEDDEIDVREMSSIKQVRARQAQVAGWQRDGGVLILGYEMYRRLTSDYKPNRTSPSKKHNVFHEALISPGPDLVVCDEGHILKSSQSAISKLANLVKSKRRIVLTGTPLQNNLFEYHCMVSFVKPSLLGTKEEFANRFANPIRAGETKDSTPADERLMKRRISVLHRLLSGCVHRRGYEHLTDVLPTKLEYVLLLRLTQIQSDLYVKYLTDIVGVSSTLRVTEREANNFRRRLFADYHTLRYVGTHPYLLLAAKLKRDEKEARDEMRDFLEVVDRKEASTSSDPDEEEEEPEATSGSNEDNNGAEIVEESSDSDSVIMIGPDGEELPRLKKKVVNVKPEAGAASSSTAPKHRRSTRANKIDEEIVIPALAENARFEWFVSMVTEDMAKRIEVSSKFIVLMQLLRSFESVGDKTLVFSQSLFFLDLLEEVLHEEQNRRKEDAAKNGEGDDEHSRKSEDDLYKTWEPDRDYFRIDGQVGASIRSDLIKRFNDPRNSRARLFLISTRAGGLGVNLIGANRVIITDVSWNPSNDLQALFRAYRFGQVKPVYIYRLVAAGTMEERIYDRQVLKQSMSQRVVDEQQILRHFSAKDIAQLYEFDFNDNVIKETPPPPPSSQLDSSLPLANDSELLPLPLASSLNESADSVNPANQSSQANQETAFSHFAVPKDRIFAELLRKFPHVVKAYHDHDSLLAHQEDQILDDTEKMAAWREYENEQKGIRVDSENPHHSHMQLTRAYQRDYRLTEDVAAYHALCYLRDQFAPLRTVVREYVEQYMPHFEAKARESEQRAQQEKLFQQQWAQVAQAQLAAGVNGPVTVQSAEEVLRHIMAQAGVQPQSQSRPTNYANQQRNTALNAIRQYAPYERDAMLNSAAAGQVALPVAGGQGLVPGQGQNSMLSSLMQAPVQKSQKPPGARTVAPPNKIAQKPPQGAPQLVSGAVQLNQSRPPSQPQPPQLQPQQVRPSQSQASVSQPPSH